MAPFSNLIYRLRKWGFFMEELTFSIYKISKLRGLSNASRLKVIKEQLNHPTKMLSSDVIYTISDIKQRYIDDFYNSFYDLELAESALRRECLAHQFITYFASDYPDSLKGIYDPPAILFFRGNIKLLKSSCFSMVGSRMASHYGIAVVKKLVPKLVAANLTMVSGLARGIDTEVHKMTIYEKGRTIAVIGSGIETVYPKENQKIQQEIGVNHLLISEYSNHEAPLKWHFPARNRIIAGLSKGVCLIEARKRSGSLITAELALEMGREVFIVPGSILNDKSEGGHLLINEGAKCISNSDDILSDLPNF